MERALNGLKRDIQDEILKRDAEDSDEEVKTRELRVHNQKLMYINRYDSQRFTAKN